MKSSRGRRASDYEVDQIYVLDYSDVARLLHDILYVKRPDILHVFWRPAFLDLTDPVVVDRCARLAGQSRAQVLAALSAMAVTASVYDHNGLDPKSIELQRPAFELFDAYTTSSPLLDRIYREIPGLAPPIAMIPDGINLEFYKPASLERLAETGRPYRIGWVGNSQWGLLEGEIDMKGVHAIISPALALLNANGIAAVEAFVDRSKRWVPRQQVARHLNTLDVYVCASRHEGTPNPVLEAMAAGVPVISTDVGIVRHVLGEEQRQFIIERSPEVLAAALGRLLGTPGLRQQLSGENLRAIQLHAWSTRYQLWAQLFAYASARNDPANRQRHHALLEAMMARPRSSFKQRIRSYLRRSPALYSAAARLYHVTMAMRGTVVTPVHLVTRRWRRPRD